VFLIKEIEKENSVWKMHNPSYHGPLTPKSQGHFSFKKHSKVKIVIFVALIQENRENIFLCI